MKQFVAIESATLAFVGLSWFFCQRIEVEVLAVTAAGLLSLASAAIITACGVCDRDDSGFASAVNECAVLVIASVGLVSAIACGVTFIATAAALASDVALALAAACSACAYLGITLSIASLSFFFECRCRQDDILPVRVSAIVSLLAAVGTVIFNSWVPASVGAVALAVLFSAMRWLPAWFQKNNGA